MCIKIKLIYLRYGNTLRWSIEVNIPGASKPFWSWNIVQRNKLNSQLLVIDFALYYCLNVHFVIGVFKVPVKIALYIVYFEHQTVAASKSMMERINSLVLLVHYKMKCEFYFHLEFWNRRLAHNVYWCIACHFVFDFLTLEKFGFFTLCEW